MKQVKISWNKGKTGIYSKETLKKMSEGRKGKNKGENNFMYGKKGNLAPKWKGGTNDYWHRKARKIIEEHTRIVVKYPKVVHHIDKNRENNDINNLVIMTLSEHTKMHFKNGDIR